MRFEPNGSAFIVFKRQESGDSGQKPKSNSPEFKPLLDLTGAWTVTFDREWFYPVEGLNGKEAEGAFIFAKLDDWSQRPESAIKHFSGTASYRINFTFADAPKPGSEYFLALGKASVSAQVILNGHDLGVVWCSPWRVDISSALKQGENKLEVKVVNCWPNRLIGDVKLPQEQRRTRTNIPYPAPKEGREPLLLSSGLLGPVRLLQGE